MELISIGEAKELVLRSRPSISPQEAMKGKTDLAADPEASLARCEASIRKSEVLGVFFFIFTSRLKRHKHNADIDDAEEAIPEE